MANQSENRTVNIYIETGEAQKAYDRLIEKEKKLNAELQTTTNPKRMAQLKSDLDALQEPISRAAKKLSGELGPSITEVTKLVKNLRNEYNQFGDPATLKKLSDAQKHLAGLKAEMSGLMSAKGESAGGFGKVLEYAAGAFLGGALEEIVRTGMAKVGDLIKDSLSEAFNAELIQRRLKSTLDFLGRGDVFDRIIAKANKLQETFKNLDNDDITAVFNRLIDYGKLTEKQIDELVPVILNYSAKTGASLEDSSSIIIKALEGNGKALKEFGIKINANATDAEKFAVIMDTLKKKVDGSNEAFLQTAQGGLAATQQRFRDLKEDIGTKLIPVINEALAGINKILNGFSKVPAKTSLFSSILSFNPFLRGVASGMLTTAENEADKKTAPPPPIPKKDENKVLGSGGGNAGKSPEQLAAEKAAAKAAEAERKQKLKEYKEALIELDKLKRSIGAQDESDMQKEIATATDHYLELQRKFKGHKEALKELEQAYNNQILVIMSKYGEKETEAFVKRAEAHEKAVQTFIENTSRLKIATPFLNYFDRNNAAGLQLRLNNTHGREQLAAQMDELKAQEKAELENKELTENEKLLVEQKFREMRKAAETAFFVSNANMYLAWAGQVVNILDGLTAAKSARENADLERDKKINDSKKANYAAQLKAKTISQQQYDRKVSELDKQQEQRQRQTELRQFRRNQRMQVVQALMAGAQGIVSTLAARPGPLDIISLGAFRAINIGLVVAATAAQVASIASQKPPTFGRGGKTYGRSHSTGGLDVVDEYGRKQAELEGEEGIINKNSMRSRRRYTISGTPSQIASAINGIGGGVQWDGGARLVPSWKSAQPMPMNFAAIQKRFAQGGVFKSAGAQDAQPTGDAMALASTLQNMVAVLDALQRNGVVAYANIHQFNDQQARLNAIVSDATMK